MTGPSGGPTSTAPPPRSSSTTWTIRPVWPSAPRTSTGSTTPTAPSHGPPWTAAAGRRSWSAARTTPMGWPSNGSNLYWTDSQGFTVWRADLDGTDAEAIATDQALPRGIAVDPDHVYWATVGDSSIWRANLDGTDAEAIVSTGSGSPVRGGGQRHPPLLQRRQGGHHQPSQPRRHRSTGRRVRAGLPRADGGHATGATEAGVQPVLVRLRSGRHRPDGLADVHVVQHGRSRRRAP